MASTIQIKNSNTAGNSPSSLTQGELAINVNDGNLFYGDGSSVKQDFAVSEITASIISASNKIITSELSAHGDLTIDADGADIVLKDGGTAFGRFKRDTSDFVIKSETQDKDILFKGNDGGSTITALTLDMSDAGKAIFNSDIHLSTNNTQITQVLSAGATRDLIGFDADDNAVVGNPTANKVKLVGNVTASANISASGDLFARSRTIAYSTATDAYSGDVVSFGSGPSGNDGDIAAGVLYYLDSSQNWEAVDADAASTATNMLGIAVADDTPTFLVKGIIKNSAYAGFTTGAPLYIHTDAGKMTSTAPSGTGDIVRVVGYSINAGSRIIYFNPSNDHIVHA